MKSKAGVKAPTEDEVKQYFQAFGTIQKISANKGKSTGYVTFSNASEATRALSKQVHNILGCEFRVLLRGTEERM